MNWKLVECEIALIVSLTVIECVNMGQNSPKDITCLTVFFCIMKLRKECILLEMSVC